MFACTAKCTYLCSVFQEDIHKEISKDNVELNWKGSARYGMTESFTHISMLIFGAVTKSYISRMFKVTVGSRMRENCTYGS